MSDYCLYPNQCGIGADCSPCYQKHITKLEAQLAAERGKVWVLRDAFERLVEASRDSDDAYYGTLSTAFVRGVALDVLQATAQEGEP